MTLDEFNQELRKVAAEYFKDYSMMRMSEGATDAQIKQEIEAFWVKYVA